ncbi:NAD(P)H-binding protein [Lentilactobacillus sp. Marseille-Q4993]|uniref:NAD(P)H-binding protein n=1 Tax=Lentilactobacillus sp. Marseille-Q4993 TaxID=3039492 RepID=UPI0024BC175D|nr:NAD(P)H-binding protein [Lentilactobacillus sp. Marseille-Q4993]
MSKVILVGGNGYIGTEITKQWVKRDPESEFYVTSRSDRESVKGDNIHHIKVDVNDAEAFEKALPDTADYIVCLTYGSMDAVKNIRAYAEKHHVQAIGNINAIVLHGTSDFSEMKQKELDYLLESDVRVENVNLTTAFSADRNDEIGKEIKAGKRNENSPMHVSVVARMMIDQLTQAWLVG